MLSAAGRRKLIQDTEDLVRLTQLHSVASSQCFVPSCKKNMSLISKTECPFESKGVEMSLIPVGSHTARSLLS